MRNNSRKKCYHRIW